MIVETKTSGLINKGEWVYHYFQILEWWIQVLRFWLHWSIILKLIWSKTRIPKLFSKNSVKACVRVSLCFFVASLILRDIIMECLMCKENIAWVVALAVKQNQSEREKDVGALIFLEKTNKDTQSC